MTRRLSRSLRVVVAVAIVSLAPAIARAQTSGASPPVSGFLSINAGLARPTTGTFETVAVETDGFDRDEFKADYGVKRGPGFDIGGGVLLRERIILGLAVSRFSDAEPGNVSISFTHPLFHPTISATAQTADLDRVETGVHIQLGYKIPVHGPLELSVFGGPSHFSVSQGLVADADISERQNPVTRAWSVVINNVEIERRTGKAWGYHVGTDVAVRLTRSLSIGALARYSRATVTVEDPVLSLIRDRSALKDLDAGGLQVMGGIRVRL